MPCWEVRETTVNLDAKGIDRDRLAEAASTHNVYVTFSEGRASLTDYRGRASAEVEGLVKQTYAALTVKAGLSRFGLLRGRQLSEEKIDGKIRISLKGGR